MALSATTHFTVHNSTHGNYSNKEFSPSFAKNLGRADPALAQWYEEARLYWQEVQSGATEISREDYQQLAQWMQWAELELGVRGSSWGEGALDRRSSAQRSEGVADNAVYTQDKNEFQVDGRVPVSDVWGSEAVLNVPPPCTVSFETSTDTRYHPPETVVKAIVTNPALKDAAGSPAQSVVFFHDGVRIACNASIRGDGSSRASDATGSVTLGEYRADAGGSGASTPEAEIAGEYDAATDSTLYDGTGQETIKFWPQGNGQSGHVSTHDVEGNADIYLKNTDEVYVSKTAEGEYTVNVKHRDGSVDRFLIHGEYTCNLNGMPEHFWFGADAGGNGGTPLGSEDPVELPAEFSATFTVNGAETSEAHAAIPALEALSDFLFGAHDAASLDPLLQSLREVYGPEYERALLTVPAAERPSFEAWIAANWNTLFDPAQASPKAIDFLFKADPVLAGLFAQVKGRPIGEVAETLKDIQTRLVASLQQLGYAQAEAVEGRFNYGGPDLMYLPVYGIKIGSQTFGFYPLNFGLTEIGDMPTVITDLSQVEWN